MEITISNPQQAQRVINWIQEYNALYGIQDDVVFGVTLQMYLDCYAIAYTLPA